MVAHEYAHIKHLHAIDLLICELFTALHWFNPFMWMLRRAIRENHEYLADHAVLTSGVNRGYYKKLLLDQCVGGQLVIANSFNYSLIKSRIKMMSKMQSSKIAITKISLGVVVAALLIIVFACEQKESVDSEPMVEKESMSLHGTFMDDKLKIDATSETLEKLKDMFSEDSGFEIIKDSLGNTLLVKKEVATFKKLDMENL